MSVCSGGKLIGSKSGIVTIIMFCKNTSSCSSAFCKERLADSQMNIVVQIKFPQTFMHVVWHHHECTT